MRLRALVVLFLAMLMLAPAATAKVRGAKVTSPVHRNENATLTVSVAPASARCSISVLYATGKSEAKGLNRKRPAAGKISWTWKVGRNTTPGRWPIAIDCGKAGSLKTSFVVRR